MNKFSYVLILKWNENELSENEFFLSLPSIHSAISSHGSSPSPSAARRHPCRRACRRRTPASTARRRSSPCARWCARPAPTRIRYTFACDLYEEKNCAHNAKWMLHKKWIKPAMYLIKTIINTFYKTQTFDHRILNGLYAFVEPPEEGARLRVEFFRRSLNFHFLRHFVDVGRLKRKKAKK